MEDGLPESSVLQPLQTRDGYLWLSSFGGLIRFDGVKFTEFNRFNSPGMSADRTLNLFEDKEGRLWIGTENGLVCYTGRTFKTYTKADGLLSDMIMKVVQDSSGAIWVLTSEGDVEKLIHGHFIPQEIVENDSLRALALKGFGQFSLPVRRHSQIVRLIDGKLVSIIHVNGDPSWVTEYPKGTFWVSTFESGLFCYQGNEVRHFTTKDGLCTNVVRDVMADSEGYIWATGEGGISRIDPARNDEIYNITEKDGLSDYEINHITEDREGDYWVGTSTGGLDKMRRAIITTYGAAQGLKTEELLSLCFKKDGNLLIGTNGGGIYEMLKPDSADWKIVYPGLNNDSPNRSVWSIYEDSQQRLWFDGGDSDLVMVAGKRVTHFNRKDGFLGAYIQAIYQDHSGNIWVGCNNGLFEYSKGTFNKFSTKDGLSDDNIRSIFEDSGGTLWVGTVHGLNKIRGNKIVAIDSIPGARSNYIRCIYQDQEGVMWFGSYGGGLIRLKNSKYTVFTTNDGLFDNIVSTLVQDDSGYFWMGSNHGISRVSRKELNEFARGKLKSLFVTSYGKQDGMLSAETNGGFQPSAVKDKTGEIYFPTVKGLVVVDTRKISINRQIPPVHIESVSIAGRPINMEHISVPYDSSDLQIRYTALSYVDPKKVQFKYKLVGSGHHWVHAGTRRTADFVDLPPGRWEFRVIACNNDGLWNMKGASIAFTILPPFWMTTWFRCIAIALFLAIGPLIYYRRVSVLKREKSVQQEFSKRLIMSQELERSRIAAELHDSLGQNILVMKNRAMLALNSPSTDSSVKAHLREISKDASETLEEVRKISYNLRPYQIDRFGLSESLRSMLKNLSNAALLNVEFAVENIDRFIPHEFEINVYRLVQESLNNVVKHSNASRVRVDVRNDSDAVRITIEDDGTGFDPALLTEQTVRHGGMGLQGMVERARISGGVFNVKSEPGNGTKISIAFPKKRGDIHERPANSRNS